MPHSLAYSSASLSLAGIELAGTGPAYLGYPGAGVAEAGEFGLRMSGCPKVRLRDLDIRNMRGSAIDFQSSNWRDEAFIDGLSIRDCYRGIHARNGGEGLLVTNAKVSGCLFGVHVDAGNNNFANGESVFNSIGILISGGANNGHGTFTGWNSRHNTYNLSCQNVTLGESFVGCNFIGGQAGADQGCMQFVNSRGIAITGGQIAYADLTIDATSQVSLRGVTLRGPVNFSVAPGGVLDCQFNIVMPGAVVTLNGAPI